MGDFFILFNTNRLKIIAKLSTILICKHQNSLYICNRLDKQNGLV
jgi:hypothetical protein